MKRSSCPIVRPPCSPCAAMTTCGHCRSVQKNPGLGKVSGHGQTARAGACGSCVARSFFFSWLTRLRYGMELRRTRTLCLLPATEKRPAASSPSFSLVKITFRIAGIVFAAKLGKFASPTSSSAARSTTRSATLDLLPRTETQWAAGASEALATPSVQLPQQPHIPTLTPAIEWGLRDAGLRRIGSDTAEGVRDDEVVLVEAKMEIEMEKVGWEMPLLVLPHPESGGSIRVPLAIAVDCHGRPRTISTRPAAAMRTISTATAKQATTRVASPPPPGRALGQEHVDGGDTQGTREGLLYSLRNCIFTAHSTGSHDGPRELHFQ
ncbi:hypothetical protein K438DRAFT_262320 [Mycena galopus ATCC 62051]|nr:hypothetical protein K438DRAFT_262320 [Mycena galopus ATCC 62051]